MDDIFIGNSTEAVEDLFANMVVSDVSMPHTSTRLSPITFTEFITRNNILCTIQGDVYAQANKFWQKYLSLTPDLLKKCQGPFNMDKCEEKHGGWNKFIDYLVRALDVESFTGHPYYQMHYLAHVNYLFNADNFDDDKIINICYRSIWAEIMKYVWYKKSIKTKTVWAPIMNYSDLRFSDGLNNMIHAAKIYIESHSGAFFDMKRFDVHRLQALKEIVCEGLKGVYSKKYVGDTWTENFVKCVSSSMMIKTDVELCEAYDSFEQDGMKCCKALHRIDKMKHKYERHYFDDCPDDAMDAMLDILGDINKGLESYKDVIEKEQKEKANDTAK